MSDKKRTGLRHRTPLQAFFTYAGLIVFSAIMLIPFYWMLSTSLKTSEETMAVQMVWLPKVIQWKNYFLAWTVRPMGRFYLNSIIITGFASVIQTFTSTFSAYAFARLRFPGRDKLFFLYLATLMLPGAVTLVPRYVMFTSWGLVNTYIGLMLPGMFSAYGTFMLRQFFLTLPRSLEEAAEIDGSSALGIFFRIIVPLSKPAIATLFTVFFIRDWNDFLWPYIMATSENMYTLPVGLASFVGLYKTDYHLLMAASIIALIPPLVIFMYAQKYLVQGIKLSGMKE